MGGIRHPRALWRSVFPQLAVALAPALLSCGGELPARPQLVVIVDTDAPVTGQVLSDPQLSLDAAVDRVRVDRIEADGSVSTSRSFVVHEAIDWPLSFGVVGTGEITLRIRAYRAVDATTASDGLDEPPATMAIDRLVVLTPPTEGVRAVRVDLASDCRNALPSLFEPRRTCIDKARLGANPREGIVDLGNTERASVTSRVGTWAAAREVPCRGAPPAASEARCIPGGFSQLGDAELTLQVSAEFHGTVVPPRPTVIAPFFLDAKEVTVGRVRALLPRLQSPPPVPKNDPVRPAFADCTFTTNQASDALPLNCVSWGTARELCGLLGGALPTEAQWNHAARGRGQRRRYPWGSQEPACCSASFSRPNALGPGPCPGGVGVEPGGSHPWDPACGDRGGGDESRDHVLDLAGSLSEMVEDVEGPYDGPCWTAPGVFIDPVCLRGTATTRVTKGASYTAGVVELPSAGRGRYLMQTTGLAQSPAQGFRCAYVDQ